MTSKSSRRLNLALITAGFSEVISKIHVNSHSVQEVWWGLQEKNIHRAFSTFKGLVSERV